ncbi:hypothetical protein ABIC84_003265 [Mucilaginibacter sp. 3215]
MNKQKIKNGIEAFYNNENLQFLYRILYLITSIMSFAAIFTSNLLLCMSFVLLILFKHILMEFKAITFKFLS